MPLTPLQFRAALIDNGLGLRRLDRGWVCLTRSGTMLQRERDAKPTPEDAVEDALTRLQERDGNLKRVRAFEALKAAQQQHIGAIPRVVNAGTPEERVVWDAVNIDGAILSPAHDSPLSALRAASGLRGAT